VALYRHIIEMTDGIEVLISQGSVMPTVPLLRSSFESLLYQEYIVENDQEYTRRSLSWLVGYVHQRLALYERLDPTTNRGKAFQQFVQADTIASKIPYPSPADLQRAVANLESFLRRPHIQTIEAEFSGYPRTPQWYRLYKGPSDLAALAQHLGKRALYDMLYRSWSRTAHGQDLLAFLGRTPEGEGAINPIRNTQDLRMVASYGAMFLVEATRHTIGIIRPGESIDPWYAREIFGRYQQLIRSQRA
jgi:hypothetical protein